MKIIGDSIQEAIDWTQDFLCTTRPLAERTLFSLLADAKIVETEVGFVLNETDEEEVKKRHTTAKHHFSKNRTRFKFHAKRKNAKQRFVSKMKHLDSSDAADEMWDADNESSGR